MRSAGGTGLVAGVLILAGCSPSTEPRQGFRVEALTEITLTGTVGSEVTPAPTVRAIYPGGRSASGIAIAFAATGGGTIAQRSVRTDGTGIATVGTWTLGPTAGVQTVTARSEANEEVVFTATADAGPVAQLTRFSGNIQRAVAGASLPHPLRVRVTDRYGNPVTATPVTFTVISGSGAIDGSTAVTDLLGIATSGAWTLGLEPGPQQVGVQAGSAQTVFTAIACDAVCRELSLALVRDGKIFVTSFDGTKERPLTDGPDAQPAWSPDGRRIAFVRGGPVAPDIYLVDADGSNAMLRWSGRGFSSPAWSPDGRTLAVHHTNYWDGDIYLLSVEDTRTAPVHVASMAAMPAWSPDGRKIAFVSLSGDDGYHALYVMNADGSNVTALTLRDEGSIWHPTWSPDGQRIAFTKCIAGACDIVAVSANATAVTAVDRLTTVGNAFSPAWSPDGFWIAFTLGSYPALSVAYIAAIGGGEPILLGSGSQPAWRP